jgi:class 3 adenylate cyclase
MTTDLDRLRRAGGGVLRLLVDLIPVDLHGDSPATDVEDELALVFADVADYSDFVAETGDDAAMVVLGILDDLVDEALAGSATAGVVKRLGDGIMIVTDDPAEAVDIAVALVDGFTVRTVEAGYGLRLRAGVHRGTVRRRGGDVFGYHVNLAARLTASAGAGQALATAHALAGVDLEDLSLEGRAAGSLTAKGVTRPVETFVLERVEPDEPVEVAGPTPRTLRLPRVPLVPRVPGLDRRRSRAE